MGDGGFFKGTSLEQDSRFSDKQKKLLKSMNFPSEFNLKVDLKKVNLNVIRPWVAQKIVELLGGEDEVVVNYVFGLLEEPDLDPRMMQINLTGFLETDAPIFVTELWQLLLSAQEGENGIPAIFLEQKMEQIRKKQEEDERILLEIRKRREKEEEERTKLRDVRERERREERERKEGDNFVFLSFHGKSFVLQANLYRNVNTDRAVTVVEVEMKLDGLAEVHDGDIVAVKVKKTGDDVPTGGVIVEVGIIVGIVVEIIVGNIEDIKIIGDSKESIDRNSHVLSPKKNNRKDVVVTDDDLKKRTVELVEDNNTTTPNSPIRKKVVDGPYFKSKWNDDEDEEESVESKKKSNSDLEQLEQLRAKAFESMRNRK
ncbi:4801_t:CDS:2 [Funneliformis caledonium]|uniref:4801_t:CDS:1 n=1 Tax=Funneliformis caledonium TaxID=1117310 RepID=A0A9N8Z889_9GLOM|nr:4801_t:CDS:2 [Funneliformis caledonium]